MEGKKLNLDAPLMSVRRIAATPVSTNGDSARVTPRLSNGRHTLPFPKSDYSLEQVTKPVTVPFYWEDIPGKSKEEEEPATQSGEGASFTSRPPPGMYIDGTTIPSEKNHAKQNVIRPHFKSYSLNDNVMEVKYLKGGMNERRASEVDDEEDVYSDAHETLSPPTESFSMNCSATGMSQSHCEYVKPSIDPQTRDFMMERFLPAAKAMALETPHIALKKQYTAPLEEPRQVTRVVGEDTSPLPNKPRQVTRVVCPDPRSLARQQRPHMELVPYKQNKKEEESEGEDDEYDHSAKGCGLFPRLGLRNSFCPLPVAGMRVKARALMPSSSGVAKLVKTPPSRSHSLPLKQGTKTTNSQSHSQPLNKVIKAANSQSHSQVINKHDRDAFYKLKVDRGFHSAELRKLENKQVVESIQFRHSGELPKARSSPFRQSRSACISPYRNERPKSPFTGAGFLGVPKEDSVKANSKFNMHEKGGHKFPGVSSHQRNKQGSSSMSSTVEKTLYVDTVNTIKSSRLNSSSLDSKEREDSSGEESKTFLKRSGIEETSTDESLFQDIKCLTNFKSNGVSEPALLEPYDHLSHFKGLLVAADDSHLGLDMKNDHIMKVPGNANTGIVQSALPPPLPKSPSQSWLLSTLSSIPSQRSISPARPRRLDSKTSSIGTKWETIVKTSKVQHDHVRYSEELINHVSQHSMS